MSPTSTNTSLPSNRKSVLLVDDTPENLQTIGLLLQPHYRVLAANGGAVALEVAQRSPHPDIILLDIMMPEIDGYEVLRQLKAAPETADIPVILVTAMDSNGDEAHGFELGAVDYITKPVIPALLLARVHAQLALKEARDWLQDRNAVLAAEVSRQVVELKAAKEAAEAASHAKSVFINNMSHELLTPMNGVIGMLQLVKEDIHVGNPMRDYLQIAEDSANNMVKLLNTILEYAAIAHDAVKLHKQSLNIAALLRQLEASWRAPAEKKHLSFTVTLHSGTPEIITGDETRLQHVLAILLDNAVKFTAEGKIELGAQAAGSSVHFWVHDTGIGVPTDKVEAIFKPFEQADNSYSRQYSGPGLGLAIAQRLVELMDGRLWVETTQGAGSTFHVLLQGTTQLG